MSTSIDPSIKQKFEPVLKVDYMSSDESIVASEGSDDVAAAPPKKFVKHQLKWWSDEFQKYIDSLDRKILRSKTDRAKRMTIPIETNGFSKRNPPPDCPDWAYHEEWILQGEEQWLF